MDLKLVGSVIELLEEQSGEGRNGPWRKRDFILETEGPYPKQVCITQWGDDIEAFDIREGDRLTAHIDLRSREYQGRWYTDVRAWRVEKGDGDEGSAGGAESSGRGRGEGADSGRGEGAGSRRGEGAGSRRSASSRPPRQDSAPSEESDDDLPF